MGLLAMNYLRLLTAIGVLLVSTRLAYAEPYCPGTHRVIEITDTWSVVATQEDSKVLSQDPNPDNRMYPCDMFYVEAEASDASQDGSPAGTYLGITLHYLGSSSADPQMGLLGLSVPKNGSASGSWPTTNIYGRYFGTPHSVNILDILRFKATTFYSVVTFTIRVHLISRPGFNRGGTGMSTALPVQNTDTTFLGTLSTNRQHYYKVTLPPGGRVRVSGTLTNWHATHYSVYKTRYYSDSGQVLTEQTVTVPIQSTNFPFTGHEYVNTLQTPRDVYVVFYEYVMSAWLNFQITVQVDGLPPPQLKLFLEADSPFSFSLSNPSLSDDIATFVPGASPTDGFSVSLPQTIQAVAAYIDGAGVVVPPPSTEPVNFKLLNVSAFKGIAMNASHPDRDDNAFDYEIDGGVLLPDGGRGVFFGADNTARLWVRVWDYGGVATVTASHLPSPGPPFIPIEATPLRLPKDDNNNNWIADGGWRASTSSLYGLDELVPDGARDDDSDGEPVVMEPPFDGLVGDALTRFEEYRGFLVSGQHVRTSPRVKDLFVSSNVVFEGSDIGTGFAFPNMPLVTHRIFGQDEIDPEIIPEYDADRVVNGNFANAGSGGAILRVKPQKALRVILGPASGAWGETIPLECHRGGTEPAVVDSIEINVPKHQTTGAGRTPANTATQIANEIKRTVGHEIGHGVHIDDRPATPVNPSPPNCADGANVGTAPSIMNQAEWFDGPDMSDPKSQYNPFDVAQIRVRLP